MQAEQLQSIMGRWPMGAWGCGERVRASCRACPVLPHAETGGQGVTGGGGVTTHSPAPSGPGGAVPRLPSLGTAESSVHGQALTQGPETKLTVHHESHPITT